MYGGGLHPSRPQKHHQTHYKAQTEARCGESPAEKQQQLRNTPNTIQYSSGDEEVRPGGHQRGRGVAIWGRVNEIDIHHSTRRQLADSLFQYASSLRNLAAHWQFYSADRRRRRACAWWSVCAVIKTKGEARDRRRIRETTTRLKGVQ